MDSKEGRGVIIVSSEPNHRAAIAAAVVAAGLEVLGSPAIGRSMAITLGPSLCTAHVRTLKNDFGKRGKKGKSLKNWQV